MKNLTLATITLMTVSPVALAVNPTFNNAASNSVLDMALANTCILRFNDNIPQSLVKTTAQSMLFKANSAPANAGMVTRAQIKYLYKNTIKGMAVNMSCDKAKNLFDYNPMIMSFSPDGKVFASGFQDNTNVSHGYDSPDTPQQIPWSVTRVGGPVDGSGHIAWVVDTGIDLKNADLKVDSSRGFSVFKDGPDAGMDDESGHGTHVSGIIAALNNDIDVVGVAAGATVVPIKVLNSFGVGSWSGVVAGLDYVAAHAKPGDCINISLGGSHNDDVEAAVIRAADRSGAFIAVAAGNESESAVSVSPAGVQHQHVYAISATDSKDRFANFSNYGIPPIKYGAPGVDILSLKVGGGTVSWSGTSQATPAACAILMMTHGKPFTDGFSKGPDGKNYPIIHL
ncbi:MAG: S8 family serine peptidase [Shewanella sp.]|nr:S8 family serine peptidase [Shewanella sp.]MCF1431402.1 S8 family serine peptidase [Shewanella sp.]MCF1439694.1 S8 family serine peptidase [Shewanella sp.]MCF1458914.1 S8 family serine peptidase [Shewanella sp.]